jgi:hypothetical protein
MINNETKFICNNCNYKTCRKSQYDRHLLTTKHIKMLLTDHTNDNDSNKYDFNCISCNKKYKSRVGLWNHKKKCIETSTVSEVNEKIIVELFKQNNEFHQLLVEQNKIIVDQNQKLIDLSSKPTTIINTNVTKNSFNLNFFLNEQCKDAMNITDFVNSLSLKLTDLENTGKYGFVKGISQIFIKGLKELDIYKRPIHCSDVKRETIYVKNQDIWEKEKEEHKKLHKTIRQIAHKNIKQIPLWIEQHPESVNYNSKQNDQYLHIVSESMGGIDDEQTENYYNKIIKNVSKEVIIC